MSDKPPSEADTDPAPAPTPAPTEPAPTLMGLPLAVFVKGGTTTEAWDRAKKRQYAQSDELRAAQDRRYDAIEESKGKPNVAAGMLSRELLGRGNPKIVIEYVYGDSALNRDCLGELCMAQKVDNPDESEMVLLLVCPYCLHRTGRMEDSQVVIRESHRAFWLDDSKKRIWVNPVDGSVHPLAGNITLRDRVQCGALGCTWAFRIDDSKLREC
jgi:hypothetical protein